MSRFIERAGEFYMKGLKGPKSRSEQPKVRSNKDQSPLELALEMEELNTILAKDGLGPYSNQKKRSG